LFVIAKIVLTTESGFTDKDSIPQPVKNLAISGVEAASPQIPQYFFFS